MGLAKSFPFPLPLLGVAHQQLLGTYCKHLCSFFAVTVVGLGTVNSLILSSFLLVACVSGSAHNYGDNYKAPLFKVILIYSDKKTATVCARLSLPSRYPLS